MKFEENNIGGGSIFPGCYFYFYFRGALHVTAAGQAGPSVRRRGPLAVRMAAAVAGGGRRAGWGKMGVRTLPQVRTTRILEGTPGNYAGGSLSMEISQRSFSEKSFSELSSQCMEMGVACEIGLCMIRGGLRWGSVSSRRCFHRRTIPIPGDLP